MAFALMECLSTPGLGGGGGAHSGYFWVGVCCWDSETLYPIPDHVQLILQPYTRLDTENPYPIPEL